MDVHLDTTILKFLIEFCQNVTNAVVLRSSIITFVNIILEKKSAPLYTVKAQCAITGCPLSATIKKFDKSDMLNITFEGGVIHPIGEYKARRRIDKEK